MGLQPAWPPNSEPPCHETLLPDCRFAWGEAQAYLLPCVHSELRNA